MTDEPRKADIVLRLRGLYPLGPVDEEGIAEMGWRKFDGLPPIWAEAADEIERLRGALEDLAHTGPFLGHDIDGGDCQDILEKRGLLMEVPADEQFREDWGFDTMMVFAWHKREATP